MGTWATFADGVNFATARRVMFQALDSGINYIDTAPSYADGLAEEWLGRFLTAADRSNLVISTKAFFGTNAEAGPTIQGLGRKAIHKSVEASLRRLRCECIDLLYCHRPDADTPLEETIGALADLRTQGKLHAWGACRWSAELLERAIELGRTAGLPGPSAVQEPFNRLFTEHANKLAPRLATLGISLVGYSLLARGVLSGKYLEHAPAVSRLMRSRDCTSLWNTDEADLSRIRRLREHAHALGLQPATLVVIDALRRSPCDVLLTAASAPEQVTAIAEGMRLAQDTQFEDGVQGIFIGIGG